MTTQSFKTVISKSGTRAFIALPFNPNDVWGTKQRHYITGTVNGNGVRGSLGSDGTQYFLPLGASWRRDCGLEAGAEVDVVLSPEGPQSESLSSVRSMQNRKPKRFSNRWLLSIETRISNGLRAPNGLKRVLLASAK